MKKAFPHFILDVSSPMILITFIRVASFAVGSGLRRGCFDTPLSGRTLRSPGMLLAVLPDEDRRPGQHARYEPPRGLQDQEKEKDPRYEC